MASSASLAVVTTEEDDWGTVITAGTSLSAAATTTTTTTTTTAGGGEQSVSGSDAVLEAALQAEEEATATAGGVAAAAAAGDAAAAAAGDAAAGEYGTGDPVSPKMGDESRVEKMWKARRKSVMQEVAVSGSVIKVMKTTQRTLGGGIMSPKAVKYALDLEEERGINALRDKMGQTDEGPDKEDLIALINKRVAEFSIHEAQREAVMLDTLSKEAIEAGRERDSVFKDIESGPQWSKVRDGQVDADEYMALMFHPDGTPRFHLEGSRFSVLKKAFHLFDEDNSGVIDQQELEHCLRALGERAVLENITAMLSEMDQDNDGMVSLSEFIWAMGSQRKFRPKPWLLRHMDALFDLYRLVDPDNSGTFRWLSVSRAMRLFKIPNSKEDVEQAMAAAGAPLDHNEGVYTGTLGTLVRMVVCPDPAPCVTKLVEAARDAMEIMSLFDDDGGGEISSQELSTALMKLFRRRPTAFELTSLISSVDKDESGFIDFGEFSKMLYSKPESKRMAETLKNIKNPIDAIHNIFRLFCVDARDANFAPRQMGVVECGKIMRCLGEDYSDKAIKGLIDQIDDSGTVRHNGRISVRLGLG